MLGSHASRGSPFLSLRYKILDIADWCKRARNWVRAGAQRWLEGLRDIPFRSKKRSGTSWNLPAATGVRSLFLFVPMLKITSSALEFAPIDGQLRGPN